MPARLFSYPYGGTYQRVDYARRRFGYPYVGFYYGTLCSRLRVFLRSPVPELLRLQQQLLPLAPLLTRYSLKRDSFVPRSAIDQRFFDSSYASSIVLIMSCPASRSGLPRPLLN